MKILFVHGYNSDSSSGTGKKVKDFFVNDDVFCPTFDLFDVEGTLKKIASYEADLIVGHSLGGFYVVHSRTKAKRIVINPCMFPSYEIPQLGGAPEKTLKQWADLEKETKHIEPEDIDNIYGIFGMDDALFSYYETFRRIYGKDSCCLIAGTHRMSVEQIYEGLTNALNYKSPKGSYEPMSFDTSDFDELYEQIQDNKIKKFIESTQKLNENFKNVFPNKNDIKSQMYLDEYAEEAYQILQDGYRKLGGIKGCNSIEDLKNSSDFWKLKTTNGELQAVVIYTFKRGGRKVQYASCKPTTEGKMALYQIIQDDIRLKDREAWIEASDALEHIYVKFGASPVPIDLVRKAMHDKKIYNSDDPEVDNLKNVVRTKKEPDTEDYHYVREIGTKEGTNEPEYHEKITLGNFPKKYY